MKYRRNAFAPDAIVSSTIRPRIRPSTGISQRCEYVYRKVHLLQTKEPSGDDDPEGHATQRPTRSAEILMCAFASLTLHFSSRGHPELMHDDVSILYRPDSALHEQETNPDAFCEHDIGDATSITNPKPSSKPPPKAQHASSAVSPVPLSISKRASSLHVSRLSQFPFPASFCVRALFL